MAPFNSRTTKGYVCLIGDQINATSWLPNNINSTFDQGMCVLCLDLSGESL